MFGFECKLVNLRIFLLVCMDVILLYLDKNSFNYFLKIFLDGLFHLKQGFFLLFIFCGPTCQLANPHKMQDGLAYSIHITNAIWLALPYLRFDLGGSSHVGPFANSNFSTPN